MIKVMGMGSGRGFSGKGRGVGMGSLLAAIMGEAPKLTSEDIERKGCNDCEGNKECPRYQAFLVNPDTKEEPVTKVVKEKCVDCSMKVMCGDKIYETSDEVASEAGKEPVVPAEPFIPIAMSEADIAAFKELDKMADAHTSLSKEITNKIADHDRLEELLENGKEVMWDNLLAAHGLTADMEYKINTTDMTIVVDTEDNE
jgi:hypothetical protein